MLKPFPKVGLTFLNDQRHAHTLNGSTFKSPKFEEQWLLEKLSRIPVNTTAVLNTLLSRCQWCETQRNFPRASGFFQWIAIIPYSSDAPLASKKEQVSLTNCPLKPHFLCKIFAFLPGLFSNFWRKMQWETAKWCHFLICDFPVTFSGAGSIRVSFVAVNTV